MLGIGFAAPYLRLWREQAARCIALTPAQMGATRWPAGAPSLSCTAEEDALPFPDLMFDRVLLVHGLEAAESARRLLRETWRVLKDDGRLLVVAPNRSGMWAYLGEHAVRPRPALFVRPDRPAAGGVAVPGGAAGHRAVSAAVELAAGAAQRRRCASGPGGSWLPGFAGVTITEAVKDIYAAMPVEAVPRRRLVLAEAASNGGVMAERDLAALWEAHCRHEFETRDVDATMATMVAEPYVNHVPTMTGGVGHDQLKRFYKYHFIGVNPPDFR